jgi:hypothetical protein
MQAAVAITGVIRKRDYRLFEHKSHESFARQFPLATIDHSQAAERLKALSPFVETAQKAANAAQTIYHNAVVRSAGCLMTAFIALVLGTLPEQDWPRISWPLTDLQAVEYVLTWVDAIAVVFVVFLFLYARRVSRRWIVLRVGTELLRQYQFLNVVFPGKRAVTLVDGVKSQFDLEVDAIRIRVQDGSTNEIITRLERFWSDRKGSIEKRALPDSDILADALLVYLQRRARRQLGWFADSKARLENIAERRNVILLSLYCIAAGLALVKLILFVHGGHSPAYLLQLLLVVVGMSGVMTAYYINQNARSLIHRYNTQERRIAEWLKQFNNRWQLPGLLPVTFDGAATAEIRAHILHFEDLMIEELIDWVHITSHDAIELAP